MPVQFSAGADHLTWAYPKLSRQLKKCAAYILEHPSEVATLSMRRVAARADVPPSTMSRLAQALGFSTYDEFRALYRDSVNDRPAGYSLDGSQVHVIAREGESELDDALSAYRQTAVQTINDLFDRVDRPALDRAVQALSDARHVLVVGMHGSHSLAVGLHDIASRGFRNWHLADPHGGTLSHLVEDLTPADVIVCIAIEPYAAGTIKLARRARDADARVVGITDRRTSPLAACSDDILLVPVTSRSFFPSRVGAMALVEVLIGLVATRGDNAVAENVDRLDRFRREMGAYWQD